MRDLRFVFSDLAALDARFRNPDINVLGLKSTDFCGKIDENPPNIPVGLAGYIERTPLGLSGD